MADLIERKAALYALMWKWAGKAAIDAIKNLPSAQPEQQWIPCSECINYIDERCVVANHHVSEKENCMEVFGAKRRTVERRRA